MKMLDLNKISKLYFGYEDISRILGISLASARVTASRYSAQGILIRLKRNMYVLREKWIRLERVEQFQIANLIQAPSYVSLMSALDYYQITTQMQQDFVESLTVKRTKEKEIEKVIFNFSKIKKSLYFGFTKENEFFIASPEKAFLDAVYLMTQGRYNFDMDSIDIDRLDKTLLKKNVAIFPPGTQKFLENYGYFSTT